MRAAQKMAGLAVLAVLLAACAPGAIPPPAPFALSAQPAVDSFVDVVARVEPVAEAICVERTRAVSCDLQIVIDVRPGQPPNAFQTLDRRGRPIVGFTLALVTDARNADELAFVMGHESAHHLLGHIARQRESARSGAMVAGVLAQMSGADAATVRSVQDFGAELGARTYSRDFELEADALGAEIAYRAGFDPVKGAAFFNRLPDPGDQFLGTHPPNAQRIQLVRQVLAQLQAGG
jgi:Zn-dependent protease with chaperone function